MPTLELELVTIPITIEAKIAGEAQCDTALRAYRLLSLEMGMAAVALSGSQAIVTMFQGELHPNLMNRQFFIQIQGRDPNPRMVW